MKITISKATAQNIMNEMAEIAVILDPAVTVKAKQLDFQAAAKEAAKANLANFRLINNLTEFSIVIEDEVFYSYLRFYRKIAKPLAGIIAGFKAMMPLVVDELSEINRSLTRKR